MIDWEGIWQDVKFWTVVIACCFVLWLYVDRAFAQESDPQMVSVPLDQINALLADNIRLRAAVIEMAAEREKAIGAVKACMSLRST